MKPVTISVQNPYMKEVGERFVKTFLDVVIALTLVENRPLSGYRIIENIYEAFNVFIAPSVLYPTLHSMQKRGHIVKHKTTKRGGIFMLTPSGEAWLSEMVKALSNIRYNIVSLTGSWEKYAGLTFLLPRLIAENLEETSMSHPMFTTKTR